MRVPVSVTLGGRKVPIKYMTTLPGEGEGPNAGETDITNFKIYIAKDCVTKESDLFPIILHEFCHLAWAITGHTQSLKDGQEEPLVYALENMLAPLLSIRDTKLFRWREVRFPFEDEE